MTRYKNKLCLVALLGLGLVAAGYRFGEGQNQDAADLKITLAVSRVASSALIAIADERGFFKEEGLDVTIDIYPSGRDAMEAMSAGKAQLATVADIALAAKIHEQPLLRVLASIGTTIGSRIVARKDRHIALPVDLIGKKIGYSKGTVSEYFLSTFLLTENIPVDDVQKVDIPPSRQVEALVSGEVDAVSAFENYAYEAGNLLGEKALSWHSQNNLAYHWLLVTRKDLAPSSETLVRMLRALIKAEDYARGNMALVTTIIARRWGADPAYLRTIWTQNRLTVSFGQSIVTSLENFELWQQQTQGISGETVDVLEYLDPSILEKVAPAKIGIYR